MRIKGEVTKWASGVLGAVCLVLAVNLVWHNGVRAGGVPKPTLPPVHTPLIRRITLAPPAVKEELSRYDSEIKLDLLTDIQSRPLPEIERNPFEFPPARTVSGPVEPTGPQLPPPPPPPPPMPFKLIGYSEKAGGLKEAIIEDAEEIYVVHEGETFAKKYRVNKITPTMAEIVDTASGQTAQLPIAVAP